MQRLLWLGLKHELGLRVLRVHQWRRRELLLVKRLLVGSEGLDLLYVIWLLLLLVMVEVGVADLGARLGAVEVLSGV